MTQQEPNCRRDDSNGDDHRHKHTGNFVRDLGDGCLRGRCIADHLNDLGKSRILPYAGGPAEEKARLIQRSRRDTISRFFIHRDALAGQRRFVDCTAPLFDHTVDRDILAGTDHEDVSGLDLLNGDFHFLTVP